MAKHTLKVCLAIFQHYDYTVVILNRKDYACIDQSFKKMM